MYLNHSLKYMLIVLDLSTLSSIYLRYVPQRDVKTWGLKLSYIQEYTYMMKSSRFPSGSLQNYSSSAQSSKRIVTVCLILLKNTGPILF